MRLKCKTADSWPRAKFTWLFNGKKVMTGGAPRKKKFRFQTQCRRMFLKLMLSKHKIMESISAKPVIRREQIFQVSGLNRRLKNKMITASLVFVSS